MMSKRDEVAVKPIFEITENIYFDDNIKSKAEVDHDE